ncbi:FAD-dependent oxidoreductase [Rhodococcus oxybenzonivorans]|uniref:FAD-dependent oxidoreductase n=1 Tax=Rhodococcus oxybenzonivorans TaxID=1990687 RepID=UPI001E4106BD|nr:FAD-dependent oxidoreductase [Rhodococcus oxybenzonivorans]
MDVNGGVSDQSFDVLIIGGGNAGLSAAGRLIRRGITDVAVVERSACTPTARCCPTSAADRHPCGARNAPNDR